MKILFINAYFMPEIIAFSHLEQDIIEALLREGHEIYVLAPIPTRGISEDIKKKYKSIYTEELYNARVHVKRFWAPQEKRNILIRAMRYLWCNMRQYQIGKKYKNIDYVFAVSTPPTQGYVAGKICQKIGCPMIYSLQDIFPDSLVTTGITENGSLIWKIGALIEKKIYEFSKYIVVISETFKWNLIDKGVQEEKIKLIPNWVDTELIKPVCRKDNFLIKELDIDASKFLVVYAGNFGAAQGADVIIKAAEQLKKEKNILFVIFGGGSMLDEAKAMADEKELNNILWQNLLPQKYLSEVYSLGDVALISCKAGVGKSGMPSKTWSIMACNTQIIAAFDTDSELNSILSEANAGVCIPPENEKLLAECILEMYNNKIDNTVKNSAREFVCRNASKSTCTAKYAALFGSGICE